MENVSNFFELLKDNKVNLIKTYSFPDHYSYKGEGNFEGWMKRILVNSCLNYIKKEKKYAFDFDATLMEQRSTKWDSAISEMSFDEILALINRLPVGYKTVFNLSVFEGYSHKEIGEMIGITESASRSQLSKAKNKLGYFPVWDCKESVERAMNWYVLWNSGVTAIELCNSDFDHYENSRQTNFQSLSTEL